MIEFSCPTCAHQYAVPDAAAGRKAKCQCGQIIIVPTPAAPAAPPALPDITFPTPAQQAAKLPMRARRLSADAAQMTAALANFPPIRIKNTMGNPPESYEIEYNIRGLERNKKGQPIPRDHHLAEITLTLDYPRLTPKCRMLTPIFHPHIDPSTICVGDHWTAGERLIDLTIRIAELISYQAYNIKSPLDAEAAMWADLHAQKLPTDSRILRPAEMD